jgi:CheY-like chemotaxis protein
VEDNELNREIATEILKEEGLTVEEAVNGSDAVDKLLERGSGYYDLVLMDIQMPVMDGYTAAQKIRTFPDKKLADIPIIAVSANAFEEDKKKSFDAGMNAHISKPIDAKILMDTLTSLL